jgi:hypothetical protein
LLLPTPMRRAWLLLGSFVLACSGARQARTLVVDGADATIEPDRLTFPAAGHSDLLALAPGDTLVSAQGYLREVVSVASTGGEIVVATRPGALDAAHVHQQAAAAAGKADTHEMQGFSVGFGHPEIANEKGVRIALTGGHFDFQPALDVDVTVEDQQLTRFALDARGEVDGALEADIEIAGAVDHYVFKKLWRAEKAYVQLAGPVPIVEVVELSVGVGFEVAADGHAKVHVGGTIGGRVQGGAVWEHDAFTPSGSNEVTFTPLARVVEGEGKVTVSAMVFADVEVRLYDIAGPVLRIAPYAALTHEAGVPGWTPSAGVKGTFEATVALPFWKGKQWYPYRAVLFQTERDFPAIGVAGGGEVCTAASQCADGVALGCDAPVDCAADGLGCAAGACVEGCGELDYHGGCVDGNVRWCEDGQVRTFTCPADGPGCGWVSDAVGYDCL